MRPLWTVSDRLRKAREFAHLDQAELAERIGISRATVSNYERGVGAPRRPILRLWAEETGVPLEWLQQGHGPESDEGLPASRCIQPSLFTVDDISPTPFTPVDFTAAA